MSFVDVLLIGVGLSMDAAAVSAVSGMSIRGLRGREALSIALAFGLFQGLMPLIGYFAGSAFAGFMEAFAPWVALVLLCAVGGKMIWEAFHEEGECIDCFSFRLLLAQAAATSLDALAVGVGFAAIRIQIFWAAGIIAATTFVISLVSVGIGRVFGAALSDKAQVLGGVILILIGIKMVL